MYRRGVEDAQAAIAALDKLAHAPPTKNQDGPKRVDKDPITSTDEKRGEILIHLACMHAALSDMEAAQGVIATIPLESDRDDARYAIITYLAAHEEFEPAWALIRETTDRSQRKDMIRNLANGIRVTLESRKLLGLQGVASH